MNDLPEGYVRVGVILSQNEYEQIKKAAAVTPRGTLSEAIRYKMGWRFTPYRLLQKLGVTPTPAPRRGSDKPRRREYERKPTPWSYERR